MQAALVQSHLNPRRSHAKKLGSQLTAGLTSFSIAHPPETKTDTDVHQVQPRWLPKYSNDLH